MALVFNIASIPFLLDARHNGFISLWVTAPAIQVVTTVRFPFDLLLERFSRSVFIGI